MRILVYQTAFLGDLLLSIPLIKNIRMIHPDCSLELVCRKPFGGFFHSMDLVDQIYEVDKKDPESLRKLMTDLLAKEFETVFCPHESFRSARLVGSLNAKKKVGFRRWFTPWFFTHQITRPTDLPDALRQTSLLASMSEAFGKQWVSFVSDYRGASNQELGDFGPTRLAIPDFLSMKLNKEVGEEFFKKYSDHDFSSSIAIAPGSVWPTKRWLEDHFIEFANSTGKKIFVLGSPGENDLCQTVSEGIEGAVNLAGKTSLQDMYFIFSLVDYSICNDSGTMHMASVAGCANVATFGPTTLDIGYRPWNNKALVAQVDLGCRPCGKHGHTKCPIGTHECMKSLSPKLVSELVEKL